MELVMKMKIVMKIKLVMKKKIVRFNEMEKSNIFLNMAKQSLGDW